MLGDELKGGVAVVVEAAHQPRAQPVGDAEVIEPGTNLGEEPAAVVVEILIEARDSRRDSPVAFVFRIEDAERVDLQTTPAVLGKIRRVFAEVVDERVAVGAPAGRIAERVELQDRALEDAELAQDLSADLDYFHVRLRLRHADELHVDLVELAEAALLWPLVAEHRSAREELQRQALSETVGDDRAHDAGGVFGPERDLVAAAVAEAVHFLDHDVRGLADRTREHLRELEDRRGDLLDSRSARRSAAPFPRHCDDGFVPPAGDPVCRGPAAEWPSDGSSRRRYCAACGGASVAALAASIAFTFSSTRCAKCSTMSASLRR